MYRKVIAIPPSTKHKVVVDTGIDLSFAERVTLLDDLVVDKEQYQFNSHYNQFWRDRDSQNLFYYHNSAKGHNGIEVTLEYTKKADSSHSPRHTFRSYLHYVPSSSSTNEVITQDLENVGVRFLQGYSYNNNSERCTKN